MLVGAPHGGGGFCPHFVEVFAIRDIPDDAVTIGAFGQAVPHGGRTLKGGAHRVFVILDDIDNGKLPEGGKVERFMVGTLIDGAIPHEAESGPFFALIFEGVGESESEWGLTPDDAVSAPVVLVGSEVVHRAALAAGATGRFAKKFRHAFVHSHADSEGMPVIAVGGDDVIVFPHEGDSADSNGFLTDIQVQKSTHKSLIVIF